MTLLTLLAYMSAQAGAKFPAAWGHRVRERSLR